MVALCKATADPLRVDILRVLRAESYGVLELCAIFATPQSGMSHHLKVLARAGLVTTRREGNSIFYRRALVQAGHPLSSLIAQFYATIDRIEIAPETRRGCERIHRERAASSREFFRRNADRLKENQDLIAEFRHYRGCLSDLLANRGLAPDAAAIEIGPGESELIVLLASQCRTVLAVDNAREMLAKTRVTAQQNGLGNVSFLDGELTDVDEPCDLIVANMVLHHLPSPAQSFLAAAERLNPGGALLVSDLCRHDQDWTREVCGDLWLGFDPGELDDWARDAGLTVGQGAYIGLRNGFQVQARLFDKPTGTTAPGRAAATAPLS